MMLVERRGSSLSGTCPYCGRTHHHGTADASPNTIDFGHRSAHCADDTRQFGYVLRLHLGDALRQRIAEEPKP